MSDLLPISLSDSGSRSIGIFGQRYTMALAILAFLSTATFVLLQAAISMNANDPISVDAAGRQRLLAQRVALHVAMLSDDQLPSLERQRHEERLSADLQEMQTLLTGLTEGDLERGLSGQLSRELRRLYFEPPGLLYERSSAYIQQARSALESSAGSAPLRLVATAEDLIPLQDESVALFEAQAQAHLQHVKLVNVGLFLLMMISLAAVWLGVFRPITQLLLEEERALAEANRQREKEARQQTFLRQMTDALDIIDNEADLMALLERALLSGPSQPVELLLADSSNAHMLRVAAHPTAGAPGCGVETPRKCAAVRRGRSVFFRSSNELDACPRLREHEGAPCAAMCVPVSFMGRSMGVLHTTGPENVSLTEEHRYRIEQLAAVVGARLGSIRSFEQVQLQATTDPLTGLLNRRALEAEVRKLVLQNQPFAVAIADLDHFKRLNDTHGHEAGDRALATFSKVVREVVREGDLVARFGGEEFVIVFPMCRAEDAVHTLERVRQHLARVTAGNDTPTFTASYGVSDTRCGFDLQGLVQIADAALLRAKTEGRDRVLIADMGEPDAAPPPILRPDERAA